VSQKHLYELTRHENLLSKKQDKSPEEEKTLARIRVLLPKAKAMVEMCIMAQSCKHHLENPAEGLMKFLQGWCDGMYESITARQQQAAAFRPKPTKLIELDKLAEKK
jgi:hypothetical protein